MRPTFEDVHSDVGPTSDSEIITQDDGVPLFDTHSGNLAQINVNFVHSYRADVNYTTRSRPVRDDQEEIFYKTDSGDIINPNSISVVGENPYASSYVLQMVKLRHKACIFYDSGSNGNLIHGELAEDLKLRVINDRPTGIGTAGAGGVWSYYGQYSLGLGPDQEGYYYKLTCQGMKEVTDRFTKYNLQPINKELKNHDPQGLGKENLPLNIGGMKCSLLLGINCKLKPILLTVLPSGLGVYRCQLKDMWGSRIAYGGPHSVFSAVFSHTKNNVNHSMEIFKQLVSQYLSSPYVQLGYVRSDQLEETVPGMFMVSNHSPETSDLATSTSNSMLVGDTPTEDDIHTCCPHTQASHIKIESDSSIKSYNVKLPSGCKQSYKSRVPLSKLKVILDDEEDESPLRCDACKSCKACSKSGRQKAISIQEAYEQKCIEDSVRFSPEEQRIYCKLPWLRDPGLILTKKHKGDSNYAQAFKWFRTMCKKPPEVKESLIRTHKDLVDQGFMCEYSKLSPKQKAAIDSASFRQYMCWNIALKPDSKSTPYRITVDATVSGVNAILAKGFNRLARIPDVITRMRCLPNIWVSDIKKLYNMMYLEDESLAYGLFLFSEDLDPNSTPIVFVMLVAWYGVSPTGGQAEVALRLIADYFKDLYPLVPRLIERFKYVDDLAGGGLPEECREQVSQVKACLKRGGFTLKFVAFSGEMPPKEASDSPEMKILGYRWNSLEDFLGPGWSEINFNKKRRGAKSPNPFPIVTESDVQLLLDNVGLTRRKILSQVAQLYDPLGAFEPYKVQLKLDLIPINKMGWDSPLPEDLSSYWVERLKEFVSIPEMSMARCVIPVDAVDPYTIRLIGIADAASACGGAAIYGGFRRKDGSFSAQLLCAKSKIMSGSIPRNELCSVQLLADLMATVESALSEMTIETRYYTDSTIAICWVCNITKPLKTFVYTRVSAIRNRLLDRDEISCQVPVPLFHIAGKSNPADLLTKEHNIKPKDLGPSSEWISGVPWLKLPTCDLPNVRFEDLKIPKELEDEIDVECFDKPISNSNMCLRPTTYSTTRRSHCTGCPQGFILHPSDVCYGTDDDINHCINCNCSFSLSSCVVGRTSSSSNTLNVSMLSLGWQLGLKAISLALKFIHTLRHRCHVKKDIPSEEWWRLPSEEWCQICWASIGKNERSLRKSLDEKALKYLFREEAKSVAKLPKRKLDEYVLIDGIYYLPSRVTAEITGLELEGYSFPFFDQHELPDYIPVVLARGELFYSYALYVHNVVRPHSGIQVSLHETMKVMYAVNNAPKVLQAIRKDCNRCRIIRKQTVELRMQNHPKERTMITPPFYTIACDCVFGFKTAWYSGSKRVSKSYCLVIVCIFTGSTNILYLEGLTTRHVLGAIERHSYRYGAPGIIYVDSGSNLIALGHSSFVLRDMNHNLTDKHGAEVRVLTAKSHEANGRCESRVRLLRQMLEKFEIDTRTVSFTAIQWETLYSSITNSLNDLPIARGNKSTTDDPLWNIITPNRLIMGRNNNRSLQGSIEMDTGPELSRLQEKTRKITKVWHKIFVDHIHHLCAAPRKWNKTDEIGVGDVVLFLMQENGGIGDDVWKLGKIVEKDGPTKVRIQYSLQSKKGNIEVKTLVRNPRQVCIIVGEGEYSINSHEYLDELRNCYEKGNPQ